MFLFLLLSLVVAAAANNSNKSNSRHHTFARSNLVDLIQTRKRREEKQKPSERSLHIEKLGRQTSHIAHYINDSNFVLIFRISIYSPSHFFSHSFSRSLFLSFNCSLSFAK